MRISDFQAAAFVNRLGAPTIRVEAVHEVWVDLDVLQDPFRVPVRAALTVRVGAGTPPLTATLHTEVVWGTNTGGSRSRPETYLGSTPGKGDPLRDVQPHLSRVQYPLPVLQAAQWMVANEEQEVERGFGESAMSVTEAAAHLSRAARMAVLCALDSLDPWTVAGRTAPLRDHIIHASLAPWADGEDWSWCVGITRHPARASRGFDTVLAADLCLVIIYRMAGGWLNAVFLDFDEVDRSVPTGLPGGDLADEALDALHHAAGLAALDPGAFDWRGDPVRMWTTVSTHDGTPWASARRAPEPPSGEE